MYRDYEPQGVKFYFIYKSLAHPETNGYVQPLTLRERLLHVKEAQRRLGSTIPWICDSIDNQIKHALGDRPNSEFIIGPDGKIVRRRSWSRPEEVRKDLIELVGAVEKPTQVADLKLNTIAPPKAAKQGVVKRLPRSRAMKALKIEATKSAAGEPYYAKLRAEADADLLDKGTGKLYIGFHLDPLYSVHWNNRTEPIRVKITEIDGVVIKPSDLKGPQVKEPSDIDPREFLVEISGADVKRPIRLKVDYFACNDDAGWCKAISQEYTIHLQADSDAGWVSSGGRGRPGRTGGFDRGRPLPGGGPFGGPQAENFVMGRVVEVDVEKRTLTLKTFAGKQAVYKIATGARIIRDRQPSDLDAIKAGDRLRLHFSLSKEGPAIADRIMIRGSR